MDSSFVNHLGSGTQGAMYGTPGYAGFAGMGMGMQGAMGMGMSPWMGMPGMTPKGMPRFNPMGSIMPHPEMYKTGNANAINNYLGVKLLSPPYEGTGVGGAVPWVTSPAQQAAAAKPEATPAAAAEEKK
jgi:hypothetical protein